jgi:hypothetical protein
LESEKKPVPETKPTLAGIWLLITRPEAIPGPALLTVRI